MTEEVKAEEVKVEETVAAEDVVEDSVKLNELKIGYVVGLTKEDNFIFYVFGEDQGLVGLLGINAHADRQIRKIYNNSQVEGDRLVLEVAKLMNTMNEKLSQILSAVGPTKPDNAIR